MSFNGVPDKPRRTSTGTPGLIPLLEIGIIGIIAGVIIIFVAGNTAGDSALGASAGSLVWGQIGALVTTAGILGMISYLVTLAIVSTLRGD